jgi:hypothetical protein
MKIELLSRGGVFVRWCRPKQAAKLIASGQAQYVDTVHIRAMNWTDQEIDELNQAALIEREKFPERLKQFYATWDELFADIADGRRWHSRQSATRSHPGARYSGIGKSPSVMIFS